MNWIGKMTFGSRERLELPKKYRAAKESGLSESEALTKVATGAGWTTNSLAAYLLGYGINDDFIIQTLVSEAESGYCTKYLGDGKYCLEPAETVLVGDGGGEMLLCKQHQLEYPIITIVTKSK